MAIVPQNIQNEEEQVFKFGATGGLPWRILLFSAILFGLSLFVFFGFRFGYESYLDARSRKIDESIAALASKVSQEDQQNLISFYSQIVNLKTVLAKHNFTVKDLDYLERYTLPKVSFSSAKIVSQGTVMTLDGEAATMQDLIEQLSVFDASPEFEGRAVVNQLQFNEGRVGFNIMLQVKPESLKRL